MKTFSDFCLTFNNWKASKNIPSEDSVRYFWQIPQAAADTWQYEYENTVENPEQRMIDFFHEMFLPYHSIMGFFSVPPDTSGNTVARLYKLTEYDASFSLDNILCSYDGKITNRQQSVTIDSGTINIPAVIKYGTVEFTNTFDGVDTKFGDDCGMLYGEKFLSKQRENHRLDGESILGTINYKTGDIHIVRSSTENEEMFTKYFGELAMLLGGSSGSGSSSTGSSSGGSSATLLPPDPYKYVNITGKMIELGEPVEIAFEYDITDDSLSTAVEDDEYDD